MNSDPISPDRPLETAVLFLVFNRPDTTIRVFDAIRKARPPRLYVAADGPRVGRAGEAELVQRVRKIATAVDWPCEVKTLFRDQNLGCKLAVSRAISWFFENEEEGIILEDDCLPSNSFFLFCEELLKEYRSNDQIFIISGYNCVGEWKKDFADYFVSHFGGIWGWATWRRAWKYYDLEMSDFNEFCRKKNFEFLLGNKLGKTRRQILKNAKEQLRAGTLNTWDYQWAYCRHKRGGKALVPSLSLIENIGFGQEATHTKSHSFKNKIYCGDIVFPITHIKWIVPDMEYDRLFVGGWGSVLRCKVMSFLKKIIRRSCL